MDKQSGKNYEISGLGHSSGRPTFTQTEFPKTRFSSFGQKNLIDLDRSFDIRALWEKCCDHVVQNLNDHDLSNKN